MAFSLHLEPGRYAAGVSLPFFVSHAAVERRAAAEGFTDLRWYDRASSAPLVNPRTDPVYSDDWDEWIAGTYKGPAHKAEFPGHVAWLVRLPYESGGKATAVARSSSSSTPAALGVAAFVVAVIAIAFGRRR